MARYLQREIGLHGNAQVRRSFRIIVPATFGHLLGQQIPGDFSDFGVAFPAQECQEQDIFRFQNRIALQLADPMAVKSLTRKEQGHGAVDGSGNRGKVERVRPKLRLAGLPFLRHGHW